MAAETPDSLMHALPVDRRPAIWPWLVMPLVALSLFYWFYSLDRLEKSRDYGPEGTVSAHGPVVDTP